MKQKIIALSAFIFSSNGFAGYERYPKCVADKIDQAIKANPCKFDSYYAAEISAENNCASILIDIALASGKLTPESAGAAKRAAFDSYQDKVAREGDRCGVQAKATGSSITTKKPGVQ